MSGDDRTKVAIPITERLFKKVNIGVHYYMTYLALLDSSMHFKIRSSSDDVGRDEEHNKEVLRKV